MSKHYTANQYDPAYKPKALRNWEVPKYYCNQPRRRTGRTRVISNNVGNLLPGVPRPTTTPWGNYIGTWHLPRRIDRKTANILNGTTELPELIEKCKRHVAAGERKPKDLRKAGKQSVEGEGAEAPPEKQPEAQPAAAEETKAEVRICPIHGPF